MQPSIAPQPCERMGMHGNVKVCPLVVDLDGTLTPTDTLVECIVTLIKRNPFFLAQLIFWILTGTPKTTIKQKIADRVELSITSLPLHEDFISWLRGECNSGRTIILATAAHTSLAHAMAKRLGIFHSVLSSDNDTNLKGINKLHAIHQHVGSAFAYAGDSKYDLPIWKECTSAVLVNASESVSRTVHKVAQVEKEFIYRNSSLATWASALRVHQWMKNILLFVPLCAGFAVDEIGKDVNAIIAFFAFSVTASGTYIFNDLWDLENDRAHPRKRNRAFASGKLSALQGFAAATILLGTGLSIGFILSLPFGAMVAGYVVLTTAYSWALKRYVLIDVIMLAVLYTFRVLAGSVATGIQVTEWLLAFCIFAFLSLALVKRCAELISLSQTTKTQSQGRDYQVGDLVVLWPLGVGASLCSIVVFGLYIGSPEAMSKYGNTKILWLVGIGLLYWTSRLWIKTARSEMHDDPLIFAIRDRGCRITVLSMVVITIVARFFN